jgi:hypothetical protein
MFELERTHALSIHNRTAIATADTVSCFFCLRAFPSSSVTKWTDGGKTALCPHCAVDAVLPGEYSIEDLSALYQHYFTDARGDGRSS